MEKYYDILYQDQKVGKVRLIPEGLYCRLECSAQIGERTPLRLWACMSQGQRDFGVMLWKNGELSLSTAVPAKELSSEIQYFDLCQGKLRKDDLWVPILDSEPFLYLSGLSTARLQYRQEKPGAIWED